jgi:hypothetical protein
LAGLYAAECGVTKQSDLLALQQECLTILENHGLEPSNKVGDAYRPHVTLAFFEPPQNMTLPAIPLELLGSDKIAFAPQLGRADDCWQYVSVLEDIEIQNFLSQAFHYTEEQISVFNHMRDALGLKTFLSQCFRGLMFRKQAYSVDEKRIILNDLERLIAESFSGISSVEHPMYYTTAGAPGTGKSHFIEKHRAPNTVYIDPDRVSLLSLSAYLKDNIINPELAYSTWRDASNFMTSFTLIMACVERKNIIHGTTATSPKVVGVYQALKQFGYSIQVELFFATPEQRQAALAHRRGIMVQVTEEDAKAKVKPVFERLCDAFFIYADQVQFYFQQGPFWEAAPEVNPALNFATFSGADQRLHIHEDKGYQQFIKELHVVLSDMPVLRSRIETQWQTLIKGQYPVVSSLKQIPFSQFHGRETMVAFDLDDTLFVPEPPILRTIHFDARKEVLNFIMENYAHGTDIVNAIYDQVKYKLIEADSVHMYLEMLKSQDVNVVSLSARRTWKATETQKRTILEITMDVLKGMGIHFDSSIFSNGAIEISEDDKARVRDKRLSDFGGQAMVQDGVIFTNNVHKGVVLFNLLKQRAQGSHVKTVVLIDDDKRNLDAVEQTIQKMNAMWGTQIDFKGYHYTGASLLEDNAIADETIESRATHLLTEVLPACESVLLEKKGFWDRMLDVVIQYSSGVVKENPLYFTPLHSVSCGSSMCSMAHLVQDPQGDICIASSESAMLPSNK